MGAVTRCNRAGRAKRPLVVYREAVSRYPRDDKQIAELRVRQRPWKEWGELGGWQYPHGCMVLDIEGQDHDDAG